MEVSAIIFNITLVEMYAFRDVHFIHFTFGILNYNYIFVTNFTIIFLSRQKMYSNPLIRRNIFIFNIKYNIIILILYFSLDFLKLFYNKFTQIKLCTMFLYILEN